MTTVIRRPTVNELLETQSLLSVYYFFHYNDLKKNINNILILLLDDKIIGAIMYNKDFKKIYMLSIDKNYRRQQYGQLLFKTSLEIFKPYIKDKISAITTKYPTDSTEFWLSQGFKFISERITKRGNKMWDMELVV